MNSLSVAQRTNKPKPLSVLQLQSLKAKNWKKEHGELVAKIKTTYGSLWKASKVLNVHWRTFHRLCQLMKIKKKAIQDEWIDIQTFYAQDNISFEMPIARASGRWFLTKTLESKVTICIERIARKVIRKAFLFQLFVISVPKTSTKLIRHPIGSAFATNVKIFNFSDRHSSTTR